MKFQNRILKSKSHFKKNNFIIQKIHFRKEIMKNKIKICILEMDTKNQKTVWEIQIQKGFSEKEICNVF